jgi:hypothetical protein
LFDEQKTSARMLDIAKERTGTARKTCPGTNLIHGRVIPDLLIGILILNGLRALAAIWIVVKHWDAGLRRRIFPTIFVRVNFVVAGFQSHGSRACELS